MVTPNHFVVEGRAALIAAVQAAACDTYEEAKLNPVYITLGAGTVYHFPEGLHTTRANAICRNLRRIPRKHFESKI
jgi:mevalonate kinase